MNNQNHLPNTAYCFFENGETEYRYFSEESLDNFWSMDFFLKYVGLSEFVTTHEGTQVIVKHPEHLKALQIDAGGLGDFFSHKFEVSIYEGTLKTKNTMEKHHLYYTLEIEKYLESIGFNHIQNEGISYWRRDVVCVDFTKKEYKFRAYESNPFNNIIDFDVLKTINKLAIK